MEAKDEQRDETTFVSWEEDARSAFTQQNEGGKGVDGVKREQVKIRKNVEAE